MHRTIWSILLILTLALAACSGDSSEPAAEAPAAEESPADEEEMSDEATSKEATGEMAELPMVDPLEVEGDVVTAGSSTVFPLAEAMADELRGLMPGGSSTAETREDAAS